MGRACSLSSTEDGQAGLTGCIEKLPDMYGPLNESQGQHPGKLRGEQGHNSGTVNGCSGQE